MAVSLYRKRPVVIEARQFDGTNGVELVEWMDESTYPGGIAAHLWGGDVDPRITIKTLEGPMIARPGWWVIQGVQGEFYPCDPDIFDLTYEPVTRVGRRTSQWPM